MALPLKLTTNGATVYDPNKLKSYSDSTKQTGILEKANKNSTNIRNDFLGTPGSNAWNSAVKSGIPYGGNISEYSKNYAKSAGYVNGLISNSSGSSNSANNQNSSANNKVKKQNTSYNNLGQNTSPVTTADTSTLTPEQQYSKLVKENSAKGVSTPTFDVWSGKTPVPRMDYGQITHIDANGNTVDTNGNILSGPDYKESSSDTTFAGMINKLSNQQPIDSYQELQNRISANAEAQRKIKQDYAEANKNVQTSGIGAIMATGQGNIMAQTEAQKLQALSEEAGALSTQLGAANTQQGLQQTGLTSAAGLAQPQGNTAYFGSPLTGNIVGTSESTNLNNPFATGNSMIDATVANALQMVAAGGDPTNNPGFDAVKALNSPQAVNAYNQGVSAIKGGTYNPTTASASAQTNASQAATYAKQASDLSVVLNTLGSIGNLTTSFLQSAGLNPDTSPFLNAMQNTTIGQLKNSAKIATYNDLVNQVQTYATQIYQSTGMTPTDAGNLAKGINIDGMTGNALKSFLANLDIIGRQKWQQLDTASKAAASSTTAYTGNTAPTGENLQTTTDSSQYYGEGNARAEQLGGAAMTFGDAFIAAGSALLKLIGL